MPDDWRDDAQSEIHRRSNHKIKDTPNAAGSPLIVSLPYPTPILDLSSFLQDRGAYRQSKRRKIGIFLMASLNKGYRINWIRPLVHRTIQKYFGADNGIVCSPGSSQTNLSGYCGINNPKPNMWELLVNSAFCIEPAGDTLTRSHFYLAILSGCVPVIIDGGHRLYSPSQKTAWAWRSLMPTNSTANSSPFVDYNEFALVYDAKDFKARRSSILQELLDMPTREPERFLLLRQGLERVAPRMRYAGKSCGTNCDDAFGTFVSVVMTQLERTG